MSDPVTSVGLYLHTAGRFAALEPEGTAEALVGAYDVLDQKGYDVVSVTRCAVEHGKPEDDFCVVVGKKREATS